MRLKVRQEWVQQRTVEQKVDLSVPWVVGKMERAGPGRSPGARLGV